MYARIVPYNNTTIETRKKKEIKDKASLPATALFYCSVLVVIIDIIIQVRSLFIILLDLKEKDEAIKIIIIN
jgi:hypothetical protein